MRVTLLIVFSNRLIMKLKHVYLALCVLGVLLPYWFLTQFMLVEGVNMVLLFGALFAEDATAFFGMDLFVTAFTAIAFMIAESRRIKMKRLWLPIAAIFAVGISLGLPLFLYLREEHLEKE